MDRLRIEELRRPGGRVRRLGRRAWREWCFFRAALRHFYARFLLLATILLAGGILFQRLEPEKDHSLVRATYYTWCLVFGEPPEEFPRSRVLQSMFFIVPVLGLSVIIEGIVDLALMLRDRRRYERSWCIMMASSLKNHIVLVGLGRLGYRTFRWLRQLDETVVVVERSAENQFLEAVRRDGSPVLIGDARREANLVDAHVAAARSIILATNDDLANLEVALDARKLNPSIRVVLRMFDQNMADKIRDGFNIHIAMSESAMSAPAFAAAAVEPSIVNSFVVGDRLVIMQRWPVRDGGPFCGRTVGQATTERGVGIVEHRPAAGEPRLFPPADTPLRSGDVILVQGPLEALSSLRRDFGARA